MKRFFILLLITISVASSAHGYTAEQERIYLVQVVNQLNAMTPIIKAAEKAQPKNQRISFHYTTWLDANHKKHNGLLEDIQEIKHGVEEKLNTTSIEPRAIAAIGGDYLKN